MTKESPESFVTLREIVNTEPSWARRYRELFGYGPDDPLYRNAKTPRMLAELHADDIRHGRRNLDGTLVTDDEDDDENVPDWDEDTDYLGEGSEPVQMDRYELERFLKRGGADTAATLEERDQLMRELEDEALTEMLGEVGGGYYDGR